MEAMKVVTSPEMAALLRAKAVEMGLSGFDDVVSTMETPTILDGRYNASHVVVGMKVTPRVSVLEAASNASLLADTIKEKGVEHVFIVPVGDGADRFVGQVEALVSLDYVVEQLDAARREYRAAQRGDKTSEVAGIPEETANEVAEAVNVEGGSKARLTLPKLGLPKLKRKEKSAEEKEGEEEKKEKKTKKERKVRKKKEKEKAETSQRGRARSSELKPIPGIKYAAPADVPFPAKGITLEEADGNTEAIVFVRRGERGIGLSAGWVVEYGAEDIPPGFKPVKKVLGVPVVGQIQNWFVTVAEDVTTAVQWVYEVLNTENR